MIEIIRMTHEEAIRRTLQDDPGTAWRILNADADDTIYCVMSYTYKVPATYAKAILSAVVAERNTAPNPKEE